MEKKLMKNWVNKYIFKFEVQISSDTRYTDFLIKHKMFPGNKLVCTLNMVPCSRSNPSCIMNSPKSLKIHVDVYDGFDQDLIDSFDVTQGMFCKIMSNVHNKNISTIFN